MLVNVYMKANPDLTDKYKDYVDMEVETDNKTAMLKVMYRN